MLQKIWLIHPEAAMCAAFQDRFVGLPNVRIIRGRFEDLESHDCFVTAGNSFGLMTAGIDAAVVRYFGEDLMDRVQHRILDQYFGEQPVGTAFVLSTDHPHVPFLVHALSGKFSAALTPWPVGPRQAGQLSASRSNP